MDQQKQEMVDELQFTCPKCGSHEWESGWDGKGDRKDLSNWEGYCHGSVVGPVDQSRVLSYRSCTFSWNRGKDDAKYMHPTGRKQPKYGIGMVSTPVRP